MSPVYFAEHCHYDNEEIAADVNCSSHWLWQELGGIGPGWQGLSHLMGGFFTVLAVDERGLNGSGCCEQHPSSALTETGPIWDWLLLVSMPRWNLQVSVQFPLWRLVNSLPLIGFLISLSKELSWTVLDREIPASTLLCSLAEQWAEDRVGKLTGGVGLSLTALDRASQQIINPGPGGKERERGLARVYSLSLCHTFSDVKVLS